ncbi:hypothetical protein [Emcibacter nanhaiensis]|uniref:Uncharacterized protein n=1 Tax=Emcibacter nanhaiensis TaxID=1505037 RepID=A0A501PNM3_9PROT|nr:hypothetical protein [Emcibacter nanhaiensis]TPD61717.1 hypothetical protein FIV46_05780 [Emcibacter nanhaiensis]
MKTKNKQGGRQEQKALETAFRHAVSFRESLSVRPPRPTCDAGFLDFAFGKATPEAGEGAKIYDDTGTGAAAGNIEVVYPAAAGLDCFQPEIQARMRTEG